MGLRSCVRSLKTWKSFYVLLSVLLLVSSVITEPVRIKLNPVLHEHIDASLEQVDAALEQIDSVELDYTSSDFSAVNNSNSDESSISDSQQLEGSISDSQQLEGSISDSQPLEGSISDSQQLEGSISDRQKLEGFIPVQIDSQMQYNAPTTTMPSAECDLCASLSLTKQQLDYVHIEMAKQRILAKLRMTEPPNITQPLPTLPHSLMQQGGTFTREAGEAGTEAFYAETEQIIILADSVSACADDSKAVCFSLTIKQQLDPDEIKAIKFHVYKKSGGNTPESDTLELFERTENGDTFLTKIEVGGDRHWLPFKIPRRLMDFRNTKSANDSDAAHVAVKHLRLECNECDTARAFVESARHKPYLEIMTSEPRARARRAAVECAPGLEQCCKVRLYVSFAEMGWDEWILSPDGYWANYCAGSCRGHHELPAHQHARIMMGLSSEQQRMASNDYHSCCSPTRLSELSLLYMQSDGQYVKKNLPNMTVQTCGCA